MKNIERRLQRLERHYRPDATTLVVRWPTHEDTRLVPWLGSPTVVLNIVYGESLPRSQQGNGGKQ